MDMNDTQKMIYLFGSARGLEHLYSKEVVHRDVRPDNIFLDSRGYPRVGDFGFAKLAKSMVVTCCMGSDPNMAPEMSKITDTELKSPMFPVDVYSYGIMFWEVVTGQKWIGGDGQPPSAKDIEHHSLAKYRDLLPSIWHNDPTQLPTFKEIVRKLEQRDYWPPRTEEQEFRNLVEYLNRNEKDADPSSAEVQSSLRRLAVAPDLVEKLDDPILYPAKYDRLTAKILASLELISSTEVKRAAEDSLENRRFLDPVAINGSATMVVSLFREESTKIM
jgi:serine/threonine protein kinase